MVYMPYNKGEQMRQFEVIFYEDIKGNEPVKDFLIDCDTKMRAKFVGLLEVLEEKGNNLREPYSKYLEDGIFEIRCKIGSDISRILYFFYYEKKIILTNGFIKKTQKTPQKEIRLAKNRRKDYIERIERNDHIRKV